MATVKAEEPRVVQPDWVLSVTADIERARGRLAKEPHTAWCECPLCRCVEELTSALYWARRITGAE